MSYEKTVNNQCGSEVYNSLVKEGVTFAVTETNRCYVIEMLGGY